MINADFTKKDGRVRLILSGHAGYAHDGSDIVCAAVSGLFYALVGYLMNLKNEGLIIRSIASGRGDVECSLEGEEAMKLACIGLVQIALQYPAHLSVHNGAFPWKIGEVIVDE